MTKKVLIYCSEIIYTPHLSTGLEIIQKHLDKGSEVFAIICDSHHRFCDQNLNGNREICNKCVYKREKGFSLLSSRINRLPIDYDIRNEQLIFKGATLNDLKSITYKSFDVGYAVASTLISRFRDSRFDLDDHLSLINRLLNNAISFFDYLVNTLEDIKPHKVFVFNGRFIYDRALMRACEMTGTEFYIFDGAAPLDKYILLKGGMIHNIQMFHDRMINHWENSGLDESEKIKIGESFYNERRFGGEGVRMNFTAKQEKYRLPDKWDDSKMNITIFLSSEDEFEAIGEEWRMDLFEDQVDGVYRIKDMIDANGLNNFRVYVRIHPNTESNNPRFVEKILSFQDDIVTVIMPSDPIDTYSLMEYSDRILVFGSTMGIEASFWGKVSINLGKSFYQHLDVCYNPKSLGEVLELLTAEDVRPKFDNNIYKYGFFFKDFGEEYQYYKPQSHEKGYFKGVDLGKYNLSRYHRIRKEVRDSLPDPIIKLYEKFR